MTGLSCTPFVPSGDDASSHPLENVRKDVNYVNKHLVQNASSGWWTEHRPSLEKALQYELNTQITQKHVRHLRPKAPLMQRRSRVW